VARIDHASYPGSPLIIYEKYNDAAIPSPLLSDVVQMQNDTPAGEIFGEATIGQTFRPTRPILVGIALLTATYGHKGKAPLIFHLRRGVDGEELARVEAPPSQVPNNEWYRFQFAPLNVTPGATYYFFLESPEASQDNALTVWVTSKDLYRGGTLMRGHRAAAGDLVFKTYWDP